MTQGTGVVLPPGVSSKIDLGDAALVVTINAIQQNEGDDCAFVNCSFPDGYTKNYQAFLPVRPEDILRQLINTFQGRYGVAASLSSSLPSTFTGGDEITFTKEA